MNPAEHFEIMPLDRLLSAREVADYLNVPLSTLYSWRYHSSGPPGLRVGKHLRYRRADVDAWVQKQIKNGQDRP